MSYPAIGDAHHDLTEKMVKGRILNDFDCMYSFIYGQEWTDQSRLLSEQLE